MAIPSITFQQVFWYNNKPHLMIGLQFEPNADINKPIKMEVETKESNTSNAPYVSNFGSVIPNGIRNGSHIYEVEIPDPNMMQGKIYNIKFKAGESTTAMVGSQLRLSNNSRIYFSLEDKSIKCPEFVENYLFNGLCFGGSVHTMGVFSESDNTRIAIGKENTKCSEMEEI